MKSLSDKKLDTSPNRGWFSQIFKNSTSKYFYLYNEIKGHSKSGKKGGVLNSTTKLDLENELSDIFKIKISKSELSKYITLFEKK